MTRWTLITGATGGLGREFARTAAAVAEELKGTSVTVTALCPGPTAANFFNDADMNNINLFRFTQAMKPAPVSQAGWNTTKAGRWVIVTDLMNKVFTFLPRSISRRMTSAIASKLISKDQ